VLGSLAVADLLIAVAPFDHLFEPTPLLEHIYFL
jgi:hypothetical protein